LGDVVSSAGSSQSAINLFHFSASGQSLLSNAGDVAGVVGFALNAVQENGGLNNTIGGFANAGANIQWLTHEASFSEGVVFANAAISHAAAASLNSLLSPFLSGINVLTGQQLQVTASGYANSVSSAQQGYLNAINATGSFLGTSLYNIAPQWFP
jgi:hypothetical protein